MQALSIRDPFLLIFEDRVVFKTDLGFLPKVFSFLHRVQKIILPTFCSSPSSEREKKFRLLDVRRSLLAYLKRFLVYSFFRCM